jgi:hypothetical protein
MAYSFLWNRLNGKAAIHLAPGGNCDIVVVGNSSTSNLTVNATSTEVIANAQIRRVVWGTDANIQIKRGANVVMVLTQSGDVDLAGLAVNLFPTAGINVATLNANSFLIMEIDKGFTTQANSGY